MKVHKQNLKAISEGGKSIKISLFWSIYCKGVNLTNELNWIGEVPFCHWSVVTEMIGWENVTSCNWRTDWVSSIINCFPPYLALYMQQSTRYSLRHIWMQYESPYFYNSVYSVVLIHAFIVLIHHIHHYILFPLKH